MKSPFHPSVVHTLTTIALAFSFSAQAAEQADEQPATPSKITAATVFTDRAIVTRTANIEKLPEGETSIVLDKLPTSLVDASVRVNGRGTAEATILDVSTRAVHKTFTPEIDEPQVNALQEEINGLEQALRTLIDRGGALVRQFDILKQIENVGIATPPDGSNRPPPSLEDMEKIMTFSKEKFTELALAKQATDMELEAVKKKLDTLRAQLIDAKKGVSIEATNYKTVTIRVSATKAGTLDLNVDYTVINASWSPSYDVRLNSETRIVELTYFGSVRQSSGEDWNNIALTLSTARPSLGSAAPVLSPWFLDIYVPRVTTQSGKGDWTILSGDIKMENTSQTFAFNESNAYALKNASSTFNVINRPIYEHRNIAGKDDASSFNTASENSNSEAVAATATVESAATSATFKIAAATSIASDNTPQKVNISAVKLDAHLQYQATPAMQETAFLSAYVFNTTDYPFLAGPTNVFLDNAFVATSALKTVMPSERFEIALGADEGVAIKRRVVNRFSETTGLLGKGGRRVTFEFLVTVTNNKKTKERTVFKEALPLARNEKITVKLISPDPKEVGTLEKPAKEVTLEEDNKLVWRIDLSAGEKREIPFKFSVDYPNDVQVSGLE